MRYEGRNIESRKSNRDVPLFRNARQRGLVLFGPKTWILLCVDILLHISHTTRLVEMAATSSNLRCKSRVWNCPIRANMIWAYLFFLDCCDWKRAVFEDQLSREQSSEKYNFKIEHQIAQRWYFFFTVLSSFVLNFRPTPFLIVTASVLILRKTSVCFVDPIYFLLVIPSRLTKTLTASGAQHPPLIVKVAPLFCVCTF